MQAKEARVTDLLLVIFDYDDNDIRHTIRLLNLAAVVVFCPN